MSLQTYRLMNERNQVLLKQELLESCFTFLVSLKSSRATSGLVKVINMVLSIMKLPRKMGIVTGFGGGLSELCNEHSQQSDAGSV